jgi:hypothetical protein
LIRSLVLSPFRRWFPIPAYSKKKLFIIKLSEMGIDERLCRGGDGPLSEDFTLSELNLSVGEDPA